MMPFFVIFAIIYFMMIRPQQQEHKKRMEMLENLKKGDRIVTTGGIIGRIDHLKGKDVVVVQIANNVKVEMRRSAVGEVITKENTEEKK
ncbi:MAG: preprotein translocase subunit YajC [Gemmatimonadetes bacterium]|nr:MAG: preprotein translocase subunit YajC [Gemmatimonadota bacterium]